MLSQANYNESIFLATAAHEAGHAAAAFLACREDQINFIDMAGTDYGIARINYSPWERCAVLRCPRIDQQVRSMAITEMLFCLLGPAAKAKVDDDPYWWSEMSDMPSYGGYGDDYTAAMDMAMVVEGGDGRQAFRLVLKVAGWCDELVRQERAWGLITTLAATLRYGERIDGDALRKTMEATWGPRRKMPLLELGRKWKKRLGVQT